MRRGPDGRASTSLKVAAAIACSVLGMALLPVLALPYNDLDWLDYDPSYKDAYGFPRITQPSAQPTTQIPKVEERAPVRPLAARVNGQGITVEEFKREMAQFLVSIERSGADVGGDEIQGQMPEFRRQVLDRLIDDLLVQQAAVEFEVTVPDEQIQIRASSEISQNGGVEWFEGWLQETGQTWEEYEQDVYEDLLRQAVCDRVTAGIPGAMEMVRARQIVLASKQDAWLVISRLAEGEDFGQVAAETSLDPWTRDLGGDLGWLPRQLGWIAPQVQETAFSGKPGQIQGPVHVDDRYVIVQTLDHQIDHPLEPDIRQALKTLDFQRWLAECKETGEIDILVDLDSPAP